MIKIKRFDYVEEIWLDWTDHSNMSLSDLIKQFNLIGEAKIYGRFVGGILVSYKNNIFKYWDDSILYENAFLPVLKIEELPDWLK